ncbi:MAG: hypothetical protein ACP6IS_07470 [Candidatus Asgardarchaeia archaeon]
MTLESIMYILLFIIFSGLGASIQKYGLMKVPRVKPSDFIKRPVATFKTLFKSKSWIIGNILTFSGIFLLLRIYSEFDLSTAAPILNLNMILVITIGVKYFKEIIDWTEYAGTVLLISGAFLMALSSSEKANQFNLIAFIIFLIVATIIGAIFIILPKVDDDFAFEKRLEVNYSIAAGIFFGVAAILLNSALVGTLKTTFNFFDFSLWIKMLNIYMLLFIIYNYLAYLSFQSALSRGRSSIVFILMNSAALIVPVIGGVLIFGEAMFISPYYRVIATVIIIIGTILINMQ